MATRPTVQDTGSVDTGGTPSDTLDKYLTLTAGYGSILFACAHLKDEHSLVKYRFGGEDMDEAYDSYYNTSCKPRNMIYYMVDPPTEVSKRLVCQIDSSESWGLGWVHLHYANLTDPISYTATDQGGGATPPSVSCDSDSDDLVIDFLTRCSETGGYTDSVTGTENYWNWTADAYLGSRTHLGSQRKNGTGSSVTMNWTWPGNSGTFYIRAISVAPYVFAAKHQAIWFM